MQRVSLQPAFILHTRAFRDNSLLVDLFTRDYGRVHAVARGVKSSRKRGLLLPFVPLLVSWSGRTDLVSLSKIESNGLGVSLSGNGLLSGVYINELLVKLLHRDDPHPSLFLSYGETLHQLASVGSIQSALRIFEKKLLMDIGYGLELTHTAIGEIIEAEKYYYYEHEHGFLPGSNISTTSIFSGATLLSLAEDDLSEAVVLKETKALMRQLINSLLRDRPLRSRELF
ncbi:MAG: DNA repair protein RecO [Gammaproteobacteria bacterium]|nr:DNA repair protein RecO [Gammaproteobacteria bacterium]